MQKLQRQQRKRAAKKGSKTTLTCPACKKTFPPYAVSSNIVKVMRHIEKCIAKQQQKKSKRKTPVCSSGGRKVNDRIGNTSERQPHKRNKSVAKVAPPPVKKRKAIDGKKRSKRSEKRTKTNAVGGTAPPSQRSTSTRGERPNAATETTLRQSHMPPFNSPYMRHVLATQRSRSLPCVFALSPPSRSFETCIDLLALEGYDALSSHLSAVLGIRRSVDIAFMSRTGNLSWLRSTDDWFGFCEAVEKVFVYPRS